MARTYPTVTVERNEKGEVICTAPITAVLTNDPDTSACVNIKEFHYGCVEAHVGSAITITWHSAMTPDGVSMDAYDATPTAVNMVSTVAADHQIHAIPTACMTYPYLIPCSDQASGDTVTLFFKK